VSDDGRYYSEENSFVPVTASYPTSMIYGDGIRLAEPGSTGQTTRFYMSSSTLENGSNFVVEVTLMIITPDKTIFQLT